MNDPLHDRLRQAADDTGQPLNPDLDDLLSRARAGRSRHRTRIAAAGLVTAVALVGTSIGVHAALPGDDPAPAADHQKSERDVTAAEQPLVHGEIIRRCLPQLAKYDDYPMYPETQELTAKDWIVSHVRDYVAGDIVSLNTRTAYGNPVLCAIPERGHEKEPVTFADLEPTADQPARIAEVCSEEMLPVPSFDESGAMTEPPSPARTPDLRGATVTAIDDAGPVLQTLLAKDGEHWTCALSPLTWDAGLTEVGQALRRSDVVSVTGSTTGSDNKSIVRDNASYYTAAGLMPREARSIEVALATGTTFSVPVDDGNFAFVHKEPGSGGLVELDYRVLDANGNVLNQGSSM